MDAGKPLALFALALTLAAPSAFASDNSTPILYYYQGPGVANALAVAGDGSIAMAGRWYTEFWVRLLPQGGTFTECRFASIGLGATAAGYQPDRKLLMAGSSGSRVELVRLPAGACALDRSLGGTGRLIHEITDPNGAAPAVGLRAMAVQEDGRAVLVGWRGDGAHDVFVMRVNADGSMDDSFGGHGIKTIYTSAFEEASGVAIAGDGKIVIAVDVDGTGTNPRGAVLRLTAAGALDTSFGGDGRVDFDASAVSPTWEGVHGVAVLRDNGIAVSTETAVYVFDASGAPRTSFSGDGALPYQTLDFRPASIAAQSDGKLLVDGIGREGFSETGGYYAIARILSNGNLDPDFGTNGIVKMHSSLDHQRLLGPSLAHHGGAITQLGSLPDQGLPFPMLARLTTSLVLTDGFSYGLDAWTKSYGSVSRVQVSEPFGNSWLLNWKLKASVDGGLSSHVETDEPTELTKVKVSFDLDPDTWGGASITVLELCQESGIALAKIELAPTTGGGAQVRARLKSSSGTWLSAPWQTISRAEHRLELYWMRDDPATAPPDGLATLLLDGTLAGSVNGIQTGSGMVGAIRFGATNALIGATGQVLLDGFRAERF